MKGTYKYTGIFGYLLMRFISDIPQIGSFAHLHFTTAGAAGEEY